VPSGRRRSPPKLAKLGHEWHVLHAVPMGTRGADIDHVVIGPAGVFTLNAIYRPEATVWVGGDTLTVNGRRQPYIPRARTEAHRASGILTAALGQTVPVFGIVALAGPTQLTIKQAGVDVAVVGRHQLADFLRTLPRTWPPTRSLPYTPSPAEPTPGSPPTPTADQSHVAARWVKSSGVVFDG